MATDFDFKSEKDGNAVKLSFTPHGPTDYQARHNQAMQQVPCSVMPDKGKLNAETAIVAMVKGLGVYARSHEQNYRARLADDGVLGPAFEEIAHSLRTLLNGEIGRLDGGLTDRAICDALRRAGFNPDVQGETLPDDSEG
jgi:hypothetical protein